MITIMYPLHCLHQINQMHNSVFIHMCPWLNYKSINNGWKLCAQHCYYGCRMVTSQAYPVGQFITLNPTETPLSSNQWPFLYHYFLHQLFNVAHFAHFSWHTAHSCSPFSTNWMSVSEFKLFILDSIHTSVVQCDIHDVTSLKNISNQ